MFHVRQGLQISFYVCRCNPKLRLKFIKPVVPYRECINYNKKSVAYRPTLNLLASIKEINKRETNRSVPSKLNKTFQHKLFNRLFLLNICSTCNSWLNLWQVLYHSTSLIFRLNMSEHRTRLLSWLSRHCCCCGTVAVVGLGTAPFSAAPCVGLSIFRLRYVVSANKPPTQINDLFSRDCP